RRARPLDQALFLCRDEAEARGLKILGCRIARRQADVRRVFQLQKFPAERARKDGLLRAGAQEKLGAPQQPVAYDSRRAVAHVEKTARRSWSASRPSCAGRTVSRREQLRAPRSGG